LHKDDCVKIDRAAAKIVAKFDKLNFIEPLLKVSVHVDLWSKILSLALITIIIIVPINFFVW